MKKIILLIICGSISISCSKTICNDLIYNDGITTLNGELFSGSCKSYYFMGEHKSDENYIDGLDHGKWIFYFKNGNVQTQGEFNKGNKIGFWSYYFENGSIWKIHNFNSLGKKEGDWIEYDRTGNEIYKKTYY